MSENYNIQNLSLDDNTFEVLPDGDYHFIVASHEVGYATSEKLPPNTQQIKCWIEIPVKRDGEVKVITVKNNLNIYKKAMFAIRQFVECIGLATEKGKVNIDLTQMDGMNGICSIGTREYNGNEYNNVDKFYPPSKAPAVTANDDAWTEYNTVGDNDDLPF